MLHDKVAIVTGGGTGIGRAVSLALARVDVTTVVVYSRSEADALSTVASIKEQGGHALALRCDVAADAEVRQMIRTVHESYGAIDYLVNNAAITRQLPFSDLEAIDDAAWDDLYAVNVKGAFYTSRAAAPFLRDRPSPAIVNVGSIAGVTGFGSSLPYAVSKAALHGLTKSLARALAPKIRVNAVVPGMVETRWWHGNEEKMYQLGGRVALERVATPVDIAEVVVSLLSAEAMTGQLVIADNGQTL